MLIDFTIYFWEKSFFLKKLLHCVAWTLLLFTLELTNLSGYDLVSETTFVIGNDL